MTNSPNDRSRTPLTQGQVHQILRDALSFSTPEEVGPRTEIGWYMARASENLYSLSWAIGAAAKMANDIVVSLEIDIENPPKHCTTGNLGALLTLIDAATYRMAGDFEHIQAIQDRWSANRAEREGGAA